ncbi:uncharacterized protein LDX57_004115 [Aspergillus melleus]|uniref:uncharacterized protein n=1 Tax=Aspergillus melleus TaxID=138277 RepID=UPI001E8E96CE|nr:uncharacterized protein LDX57_004115 [Aspergillus melleus]KAH8426377.1 hypothetical protein LDX57_004115 [Aspergillus melleus]
MMYEPEHNRHIRAPTVSQHSTTQRRDNVFEDIHIDEDVFQFIGSTGSHTTFAKNISAKLRTVQCLGELSESSLQKINDRRPTAETGTGPESTTNKFAQHGKGQTLGIGAADFVPRKIFDQVS